MSWSIVFFVHRFPANHFPCLLNRSGGMRGAIRRPLGGVLDWGTSRDPGKILSNLQVFELLAPPGVLPGRSCIPPGRPPACGFFLLRLPKNQGKVLYCLRISGSQLVRSPLGAFFGGFLLFFCPSRGTKSPRRSHKSSPMKPREPSKSSAGGLQTPQEPPKILNGPFKSLPRTSQEPPATLVCLLLFLFLAVPLCVCSLLCLLTRPSSAA